VAIVRGIETTIRALSRLFPDSPVPGHPGPGDSDAAPVRADPGALVGEASGRAMLDGLDLPLVDGASCADADEAAAAAQRIGFPVVVKVDVRGVAHRAKLGLVTVGCRDSGEVTAAVDHAYASLDRYGIDRADVAAILVQRTASGTEMLVGLHRSALGAFLTVGRGGGTAGAGTAATTMLLPVPLEAIRDAVAEASGRAAGGAGVAQAADGIARLASAFTGGPLVGYSMVEINPAMVTDAACAFVDVLMVAR
jgi:acetyltransferase